MILRIAAIAFIFFCTALAWVILGSTVRFRTHEQDVKLKNAVGQLWGTVQVQKAPTVYYQTTRFTKVETTKGDTKVAELRKVTTNHPLTLEGSNILADLDLEYRRKGLLWYSTYRARFSGTYRVANTTEISRDVLFNFTFPAQGAVYDNFTLLVGSKMIQDVVINSGTVTTTLKLQPRQSQTVAVSYESQGIDEWWYDFGSDVNQVKNFSLVMITDFDRIDFPQNSMSPTKKEEAENGWKLQWEYSNLLTGVQIGMALPQKLNPGPWVSEVSFFAPVSLFLFFFLMLIFTTIRNIKIHPMNYFFIGSAFFSFHLLLAYLVDHVSVHLSFFICSVVSIFLVVSYMRLVVGTRLAVLEVGISQFVYLVLFSYTFFLEGYTGLTITILCIITLFVVMQYTGNVDWETIFQKGGKTRQAEQLTVG